MKYIFAFAFAFLIVSCVVADQSFEQTPQLEDLIQATSNNENSVAIERAKRDLLSIPAALSGVLGGTTGFLDTFANGLSAVGSFFNISWFLNFFVAALNVVSTFLKVIQAIISLLPLAALITEIGLNLNYIISYLFSGNWFAVGIYVVNLLLAISTYPS